MQPETLSEAERAKLVEWTRTAVDEIVRGEFVSLPWVPPDALYVVLHGYYCAGLSPAEAAEAVFAVRH